MIDIEQIENELINFEKNVSQGEHSLSYMLLLEIKSSAKRWFIISMVELFIILGIVGGMIWYNSLPVEEYNATIETDGDANTIAGIGDNNGYDSQNISENSTW